MPDLLSQNIDILTKNLANRSYTTCFKVGSTYYARKQDGTLLSSSTTAETVIAAAIAQKGVIYFAHNQTDGQQTNWDLSAGFSGFTITDNTTIVGDSKNVFINVPNGFTGVCFKYNATTGTYPDDSCAMRWISLEEQGTASRLWTGIKVQMDTSSVDTMIFTRFQDVFIYDANVGIELETSNTRWINGNKFDNVNIYNCVIGVLFDQQSGEIAENTFDSVNVQCKTAVSTHGFKDVDGTGNLFLNCKVWDIDTTGTEMNIKSTAAGTIIIGGRTTGFRGGFVDLGARTLIYDVGRTNVSNVISRPDVVKFGTWYGTSTTAGEGTMNGRLATITVGSAVAPAVGNDSTGCYYTYDTGATINSLTGLRTNVQITRRILNCYFKTAVYPISVSNVRIFAGLVADGAAPASAADPLNAKAGIGLWLDSAVSGVWQIMHDSGSGASTKDSTGVTAVINTQYPVEIYAQEDTKFRFVFNGVSTDVTTAIPASTANLAWWIYMENTTAASRTMRHYYVITRTDK